MKLMYEVFVGGESLGFFADADGAQRRIEEALANDPPVLATIKLTYFGDEHEAVNPKRPTVADTGWRDEYRGMWAEGTGTRSLYVLLSEAEEMVFISDIRTCGPTALHKDVLIPRYDLTPVDFTPHPAYLETIEDYQNAPENTVIGSNRFETCPNYVKDVCGEWVAVGGDHAVKTANLAGDRRRVLYWPKEEA